MSISNPLSYPVTGSSSEEFTYETGQSAKPYNVSFSSSGLIPVNLLMFGQSEDHLREVLIEFCNFTEECRTKYATHLKEFSRESTERRLERRDWYIALREELGLDPLGVRKEDYEYRKYKLYIDPIKSLGQAFKVGWACNDTVQGW